ncbi:ribonuclease HI [Paraburkholderia graminis]|uniref:ribonuclease HI n=1 Tax=Paraburkholderia graminis TaxID=60548 RepID=UPI002794A890|nr:RNase H family protein [Paraburkholderia graminis]MDQ0627155.1 ribonuclease HI [Paraburkholderia graminis]
MQVAKTRPSPTLSDDLVRAAFAWYRTPNGITKRALRTAVDALMHDRSRTVAAFLASEQNIIKAGVPASAGGKAPLIPTDAGTFSLYSDGSTIKNPGPSGCGWVIMREGEVVHEGFKTIGHATNQISEIRAAGYGLNELPGGSSVDVYTDSLYVVKTMRGQYRKKMNLEHWQFLAEAVSRHHVVNFHHVRGHAGHEINELADRLARKGSALSQGRRRSLAGSPARLTGV